jgi:hypothetical protein
MKNQAISFLVRCQYDAKADSAQLQIVRVDTAEKVRLRNGYFLLRISIDDTTLLVRCLVRHIPSGREVYLQSGSKIHDFLKACLLDYSGGTT